MMWIYFLHHSATVSLGAVLVLLVAVIPLVISIAFQTLLIVVSASQLTDGPALVDSVPDGLSVVPVTVYTYAKVFPTLALMHPCVVFLCL